MSQTQVSRDDWWAVAEFAQLDLNDSRLNQRCQKLASALAQQPSEPIPQACEDWAATKAAYRFFDNAHVSPDEILSPHLQRTLERTKAHPLILAVQDTTFLNYTHHPQTEALGELGSKRHQQRGFGMHSTLALTPTGQPLGLVTQAFFTRPIGQPAHTPNAARQLPIEAKESYRWIEAFRQTIALIPQTVKVVTICDREADLYEMFALAQEQAALLLVRANADRRLAEDDVQSLWAKATRQAKQGELTVQMTGNQKRPARQATVSIRFCQVHFNPPWRPQQKKLPAVTLTAILVREIRPPPSMAEPIEWLLLTTTPVGNFTEAVQVVEWYCARWQIEVYHKILKSGCRIEDCRLQTAERLQNYIALMSVVAWRLHWLTYINRTEPDQPCTHILTPVEWQALYLRIHKTTAFPKTPPTVRQTIRWIAQLGGFLGRKSDGEPGITVIWRGWQRLQDIAAAWDVVVNEPTQLVGNR